jgi:hypothetical protein
MKISELIENLGYFKKEHGDLDCWFASDNEGNDYFPLEYTPTKGFVIKDDGMYLHKVEGATPVCIIN